MFMYGYVYMTTNLVNNKKYIGQHRSETFDSSYKGSGVLIRQAISKYGIDSFEVDLIERCDSKWHLDNQENYWIAYYNAVKSVEFYNLIGGPYVDSKGLIHNGSNWNNTQNSFSHQFYAVGSIATNSKKSHGNSGKSYITNGVIDRFVKGSELDFYLSQGFYKGRTNYPKGKVCVNNGYEDRMVLKSEVSNFLASGYVVGRLPMSWVSNGNEEKQVRFSEISKYLELGYYKGRLRGDKSSAIGPRNRIFITDGITNKMIEPGRLEDFKNLGYTTGFIHHVKKSSGTKIWINNGLSQTYIDKQDFSIYEKKGYIRGMLPRNSRVIVTDAEGNTKNIHCNQLKRYLALGYTEKSE